MRGARGYQANPNQLPLFMPESAWRPKPPSEWPDFRAHAKLIGCDTETSDPNLEDLGPGFVRNDAKLIGVSLASEDGQSIYLPLGHVSDNVEDVDQAIRYIRHQLGGEQVKVGANLLYDLESLSSVGISLEGDLGDVQIAEPILDEERPGGYALEVLANSYLGTGKDENLLRLAAASLGLDPKKDLAKIPARFVGNYAEADADLPIKIYLKQVELLKADDTWDIFLLERRLQKVLFKIRMHGVRLDIPRAEQLEQELKKEEDRILKQVQQHSPPGKTVNPGSSDDVGDALTALGVEVPITYNRGKKTYHTEGEWLKQLNEPFPQAVAEWRSISKLRKDFVVKLMQDSYKSRIYSSWHQLREDKGTGKGDSKGTRGGRIAASKFNLTQIPARDPVWGKKIRSLFVADEGKIWVKNDYSQQEPRHLIHFAYLMGMPGAAEARQRYIDNPATDYHQMAADMILEQTGKDIGRRPAKDINLGASYGLGRKKLAKKLGVSEDSAIEILRIYHGGLPYVKKMEELCQKVANERGYIRTLLKRKRRFLMWEPYDTVWDEEEKKKIRPTRDKEDAIRQWGRVKRAMIRKALNALIQGSAADQTKKAMILMDDEGLTCQAQVYDELNGSYEGPEQALRIKYLMEHAVESTVPFLADPDTGPSWGEVKPLVL